MSLLLLFATFGAHGQEDDTSSSICAAEGEWKTNMCAKIIDFYGDVTCRKKNVGGARRRLHDRYCGNDNNFVRGKFGA